MVVSLTTHGGQTQNKTHKTKIFYSVLQINDKLGDGVMGLVRLG